MLIPRWFVALACILALAGFVGASPAAAAAPADLHALFKRWRSFQAGPMVAGVPDYTAPANAARAAGLVQFQAELAAIDTAGWSAADKVDWRLVQAEMNGLKFDLETAKPWQRDPAWYLSVWAAQSDTPSHEGPVHAAPIELWQYSFPLTKPDADRLAGELAHIPPLLAQARGNLTGNAADLWRFSPITLAEQTDALVGLAAKVKGHKLLELRVAEALVATQDFIAWVKARAPTKTGPSGVGETAYSWYLKHVQLSPYTWSDEVAILQRELARAHAGLRLEENHHKALPALTSPAGQAEWDAKSLKDIDHFIQFMDETGVASIRPYMKPELAKRIGRWVPPAQQNFFAIAQGRAPNSLFAHFYHWWDLAEMQATPHASPIRRGPLLYNIWLSRAEGNATAMEAMMLDAGLFDKEPRSREVVWIMQAQRAARGLAALYAQANQIDLNAAMAMQVARTPNGWMSPDLPLLGFEQSLYLRHPGYGASYITGKAQVEQLFAELAEKEGNAFTVKGFYDRFGDFGMIPVALIREEWLGKPLGK
ncbi:DUF885 family protein [Sandarakinorhabdus sp.]|uniref:DUF885 family protein n=1 Tax=Sandarakinorhabdus sp. TaxID=1916663 RepID=UPI00333FFCBF